MRAIILCAGKGQRLGDQTTDHKSLTEVGGLTILKRIISNLSAYGISDITIVIGYNGFAIKSQYLWYKFIDNPIWESTNTAHSLFLALAEDSRPALLINGDVVFDSSLLGRLDLDSDIPDTIPSQAIVEFGKTGDEEIKVALDNHDQIKSIGKTIADAVGEGVGIYKLSGAMIARYIMAYNDSQHSTLYYEDVVNQLLSDTKSGKLAFEAINSEGIFVKEVDFPEDLEEARQHYA